MGCPYCYFEKPPAVVRKGQGRGGGGGGRGRGAGGDGRGGRRRGRPPKTATSIDPHDREFRAPLASAAAQPGRANAGARAAAAAASAAWQPQVQDDDLRDVYEDIVGGWEFVAPAFARGGQPPAKRRCVPDEDELNDDDVDGDEEMGGEDRRQAEEAGQADVPDVEQQHEPADGLGLEYDSDANAEDQEPVDVSILSAHDKAIGAYVRNYLESWSSAEPAAAAVAAADALFRLTLPNFELPNLSNGRRTWQDREVCLGYA